MVKGLSKPCQGHLNTHSVRCLKALKRGSHPRSNEFRGALQYEVSNCPSKRSRIVLERAFEAAPQTVVEATSSGEVLGPVADAPPIVAVLGEKRKFVHIGPTTMEKMAARLSRIRTQEVAAKCVRHRFLAKGNCRWLGNLPFSLEGDATAEGQGVMRIARWSFEGEGILPS